MAYLPADVVTDILLRLPVKPLLRFRCVSKPWCAQIDSPHFIQSHLKRSIESKNNHTLILTDYLSIYSVSLFSLDAAVKIDHPLECDGTQIEVLGSCHGLVLLNTRKGVAQKITPCIWNPSTKKHKILPYSESRNQPMSYGLGYDKVSDDYKVVRMTQIIRGLDDYQVYSLKSNSWRRIKDPPFYSLHDPAMFANAMYFLHDPGMFLNGALHWVASLASPFHPPDWSLLAFDLATEEYRFVPLPDFGDWKFIVSVKVLDGCLWLSCSSNIAGGRFDLWVMKDYGVRESWTKLASHVQSTDASQVPLAYSKFGSQLLLVQDGREKLFWFDLDRNVTEEVKVRGLPDRFESEVCVQSLVPLGGGGRSIGRKKQEKQEKKQKGTEKKRDPWPPKERFPTSKLLEQSLNRITDDQDHLHQ